MAEEKVSEKRLSRNSRGRALFFIDIMKAVMCMAVFIEHITASFYMEWRIKLAEWTGMSLFSYLHNGRLAVIFFYVSSGFLIGYQVLRRERIETEYVKKCMAKRLIHLYLPSALVCIVTWTIIRMGLIYNQQAFDLGADEYITRIYTAGPSIRNLFKCLRNICINDNILFAPQLWTMHYEILAGTFCYCVLLIFREKKNCRRGVEILSLLVSVFVFKDNFFECILCGILAGEICFSDCFRNRQAQLVHCRKLNIGTVAYVLGILEISTLIHFGIPKGEYVTPIFLGIGIVGVFFAWEKIDIRNRFLNLIRKFGEISYSFYLVHMGVIVTVGAKIFCVLRQIGVSQLIEFGVVFLMTLMITFIFSIILQNRVVNKISKIFESTYQSIKSRQVR